MERLAKQLCQGFDWYVAIVRGGLVPACLLAQLTGQRNIDTICVTRYDNYRRPLVALEMEQRDYRNITGASVLLIDDLVDKGKTMGTAYRYLQRWRPREIKTVVIYKKTCSVFVPDYFIREVPVDKWIVFPWENSQAIKEIP